MQLTYVREGDGIAPPAGAYSPAIIAGNTCYLSGQIALLENGELLKGDVQAQAVVVMKNITAILEAAQLSWKNVVMVQILLADVADFAKVNQVYAGALPEGHLPARVTYQVGALPLGALVEIQTTAVF